MSTVFRGNERVLQRRKRPNTDHARARPIQRFFENDHEKEFAIPSIAAEYNKWMNGVDQGDQIRSYTGYRHSLRRGAWQALAWTFLLDIAIINSYIIQQKGQPKWKPFTVQRKWREAVLEDLIKAYHPTSQSRKRLRTGDEFTPIPQHKRIRRGKNSPCLACKGIRLGEPRKKRSL